jgi:hypothetical protein
MFIVHSVGSDIDKPYKVFASRADAAKDAEERSYGNVDRVFVYEWPGDDLREGVAAAREGQLEPIMHYSQRTVPPVPAPEPPIRLSSEMEKSVAEIIKKMPRIARKF